MIIPTPHFTDGDLRTQVRELRKAILEIVQILNMILPGLEAEKEAQNGTKS